MHVVQFDNVDLNLLKALHVLLEERHVSRAAHRCHLSQSAMSRTLHRLRKTFDDELLVRTTLGYELTPKARALQDEVEVLLPRLRLLVSGHTFDPATSTDTVRIAATDYFLTVAGDQLFTDFFAQAPGMSLVIDPVSPRTFDDLLRGRLDIALSPTTPPALLRRTTLFEEEFVGLLSVDHEVTGERLTLQDLQRHPMVTVAASEAATMLVESRLEQLGVGRPTGLTVPYFTAAARALAGTELIAILPRRLVEADETPGLRVVAAPLEFSPFPYSMLWHPRLDGDPAQRWMRSLLLSASESLGDVVASAGSPALGSSVDEAPAG